jgi:hypothetical protein
VHKPLVGQQPLILRLLGSSIPPLISFIALMFKSAIVFLFKLSFFLNFLSFIISSCFVLYAFWNFFSRIKKGEQSLRSPLKVATIPTFRGIVAQVRLLVLKRAKKAFPAEIFPLKWYFCLFQQSSPHPLLSVAYSAQQLT